MALTELRNINVREIRYDSDWQNESVVSVSRQTTVLQLKRQLGGDNCNESQLSLKHVLYSGQVLHDNTLIASVIPCDTSKFITLMHHNRPWDFCAHNFAHATLVLVPGVEGMGSGQQNPILPPESRPTKRKRRRSLKQKSQRVRQHEKNAGLKAGGSRIIRTKGAIVGSANDRACLVDAVVAVLPADKRVDARSKMVAVMPMDRDTSPLDIKGVLTKQGYSLERASGNYNEKGTPPSLLILQEKVWKLIINVQLIDAADPDNAIHHFVAWDGATIIDYPYSVRVNDSTDRTDQKKSQEAFNKLFKRWYKSWQITAVYWVTTISD